MSLHYDITKCNPGTFQDMNDQNTHYCLCVAMMIAGIGEITEKNKQEVFDRVYALEKKYGPYRLATDKATGESIKLLFSQQEIDRFVGMKLNVAPLSKRSFWSKYGTANRPDPQGKV